MNPPVTLPRHASSTMVGTFDLFRGLSSKELALIAPLMRLRRYDVGNYIITAAHNDSEAYFLINGSVRVCAFSANGKQVHFEDLIAGNLFGEIAAIDKGERSGDCIALQQVTLAVMSSEQLLQVAQQYPAVLNALLCRLTGMIRRQMKRVYEFSSCSVSQRIRFELLRLASEVEKEAARRGQSIHIPSPPTHADIATRVSTHREAVTRELKKLESLGVIQWRPGSHWIHDMKTLVELASSEDKTSRRMGSATDKAGVNLPG